MSSTPHVSGFGESSKPSSKVLRPPGGGTSDIFGSETQVQTPRTVKNHMQSNIFGSNDQRNVKNNGDSVRRSQKNVDSYSRLFGEPERPFTPAKNHMKSNIPIGPNASDTKETNGSSSSLSSSSTTAAAAAPTGTVAAATSSSSSGINCQNRNRIENGGDHQNGVTKTDGVNMTDSALPSQPPSQNNTPRYNGVTNELNSFNQNNEKMSTNNNNINNNNMSSPPKIINYNNNNNHYNNMNDVSSTRMTNGIAKDAAILNGNNGHNINNNENDSSSGSNMNSSLISPASTSTTTTTTSSSASKYGGRSSKYMSRNPVTGYGIEEPVQRQRRSLRRDGNPVTGEGYKPAGAEINTSVPALNGANQVIIKNRIPPGGYSSGLW